MFSSSRYFSLANDFDLTSIQVAASCPLFVAENLSLKGFCLNFKLTSIWYLILSVRLWGCQVLSRIQGQTTHRAACPSCLRKNAQEIAVTKRDLHKEQEVFYLSDNLEHSLWLVNGGVKITTIYFRKVKQQSLLLLNAGLLFVLASRLVGNRRLVQIINRQKPKLSTEF